MKPKILDILALLISLMVLGGISAFAYQTPGKTPLLQVKNETDQWIYPLNTERRLTIPGPLGDTVIQVREGAVKVLSSPCREKICVKHAAVRRTGEWIACLPNRILINIQASREEVPDGISF